MMGKAKKRWLLINLQDSKQFASQVLNRDVWSHEGVKAIVSEHFLFWQIHRITDDGLRFKQLYHVNAFPYVAILDPRTGEKMMDWDTVTMAKFIPELTEFLHNNKFDSDVPEQRDNDGVADMSEEEQLQAAIRASLQDVEHKPSCNHQHNRDNDECVSLSSDDEEEDGEGIMEQDGERDGDTDRPLVSEHTMTKYVNSSVNSNRLRPNIDNSSTTVVSENKHTHLTHRKRKFSDNQNVNAPPVKMVCSSVPNTSEDKWTAVHKPTGLESPATNKELFRTEKGAMSNPRKGKHRATSSEGTLPSVEERLKSGDLQKADVSYVVMRLPDGSRMEKAFMRNSLIADLFTYLSERGINSDEHDIVTHFPKRSLRELDHLLTFQEANLYPSVTVFVED